MTVIAIFNQKGGSGKTMLCVHLAVSAMGKGRKVCIIDVDPQASAVAWRRPRTGIFPVVVQVSDSSLPRAIQGAKADEFDFILVDCPPSVSPATARIISEADLIVVPVRPEPFDLAAVPATLKLIGDKPYVFVLSDCPQKSPEIATARQILTGTGHPVFGPVNNWRAMWRALVSGQAVAEFEPDGKPAKEIEAVCSDILGYLNSTTALETTQETGNAEHS